VVENLNFYYVNEPLWVVNKFLGEKIMATVKFDEGTKKETSLELKDGESVVYVNLGNVRIARRFPSDAKKWYHSTFVITNKRVAVISQPINKKSYALESFFYKDIDSAEVEEGDNRTAEYYSFFRIHMKSKTESTHLEEGAFTIDMKMNVLDYIMLFAKRMSETNVPSPLAIMNAQAKTDESRAHAEATGASTYTEYSPNFAANAKGKPGNLNYSNSKHNKLRNQLLGEINSRVEGAK